MLICRLFHKNAQKYEMRIGRFKNVKTWKLAEMLGCIELSDDVCTQVKLGSSMSVSTFYLTPTASWLACLKWVFFSLPFFFLIWKKAKSLPMSQHLLWAPVQLQRDRERKRKSSTCWFVDSWNDCNSQVYVGPKSGIQNLFWIFHMADRGPTLRTNLLLCS